MSPYEQRVEPPNKDFQYLLFACEPYETIAFKVPNERIERDGETFVTTWHEKVFTLKFAFELSDKVI